MGKNVAVFVDVANIFYAAKAAGVDIDYVTLLKSASAGRDLVRAYAYTGLDPDNENQRNFHDFLRRSNYKVVSKDIRKYGDGKVKANLDIELVVDMMKTARNLDIAIVVSGDGDFAPAIRAVQEQGVRVEVISFRGNTSSDLIEVADQFTDIVQLAKVEKGSRSGRRVSDDDADLSMTEVPDKQTEGSGAGRGRGGRGRGRGRPGEAEPVVASSGRGRAPRRAAAPIADAGAGVVALPGERLSRAPGSLTEADLAGAEVFTLDDDDASDGVGIDRLAEGPEAEDGPRRRRRRGGRGRGRGRGRVDADGSVATSSQDPEADPGADDDDDADAHPEVTSTPLPRARAPRRPVAPRAADDEDAPVAPTRPRTTPFGSVWDSQIGTPTRATGEVAPVGDDEDFDEPEIPEYLIAEQRRGAGGRSGGGNRGPRGGRSAYQAAISRERYGRGGGGGGINRYPDVSGRETPPRQDRPFERSGRNASSVPPSAPRGGGEWSEVPPELEAQLRAQVLQKSTASRPTEPAALAAEPRAEAGAGSPDAPAPKPRATRARKPVTTGDGPSAASGPGSDEAEGSAKPAARVKSTTARPKATRARASAAAVPDDQAGDADAPASTPRATRARKTPAADKTTATTPRATRARKPAAG